MVFTFLKILYNVQLFDFGDKTFPLFFLIKHKKKVPPLKNSDIDLNEVHFGGNKKRKLSD